MHILAFNPSVHHVAHLDAVSAAEAAALVSGGPSYCAVDAEGVVQAVAGLTEQWPGRAVAWAIIGTEARRHFKHVHRAVREFLATDQHRRLELYVRADFPAAARWAERLGFVRETEEPMRAFGPQGEDCYLYAKVKGA